MANSSSAVAIVITITSILLVKITDSHSNDTKSELNNYFVIPTASNGIPCTYLADPAATLTLEDYTNQPVNFANNTIFYFCPGTHRLNTSLKLTSVHNFSMQGLPENETVLIVLNPLINITWDTCYNIEISSISFKLIGHISYSIIFEQSLLVRLFNITVLGSERKGQSSTTIQNTSLVITDSKFIGIYGFMGAALRIFDYSVVTS